jgi:hypothetical protein
MSRKKRPKERRLKRPLATEPEQFIWNMQHVPRTLSDRTTPHPSRSSAIFVVHGIGQQLWTETAAQLRAGFEDAFEKIFQWERENHVGTRDELPPPFIFDGYWANYEDIQATFPEDWKRFNEREQKFFSHLWKLHVVSGARTIFWTLGQQARLLCPRSFRQVRWSTYFLIYVPLQIVSIATLLMAWIRHPILITGFLNDVRLYLDPKGVAERATVQRIDIRVGKAFLQMIGLDLNFRPLPYPQWIEAGGERFSFERVVWVSHSLGTVISYNVLSALLHKANALEGTGPGAGDPEQKQGVTHFRTALRRFVTMGSPLDKVATLFRRKSLRPWPRKGRMGLLENGETIDDDDKERDKTEWWINFYSVLDPVSGALEHPFICGDRPPMNIHIPSAWIPGLAHVKYWTDSTTLRFILGRTYGTRFLKDQKYKPWSPRKIRAVAVAGYVTWCALLGLSVGALYHWGPAILRFAQKAALKWIAG